MEQINSAGMPLKKAAPHQETANNLESTRILNEDTKESSVNVRNESNTAEKEIVKIAAGTDLNYIDETPHNEIFFKLLQQVTIQNLRDLLNLEEEEKPTRTQLRIKIVDYINSLSKQYKWNICRHHDFIYSYNNAFWSLIESTELEVFLGEAAEKMGIKWDYAQDYKFREELLKQFMSVSNLPMPEQKDDETKINLRNGTFVISSKGHFLRNPDHKDFLKYRLPFEYNPESTALLFFKYLDKVLPDKTCQMILAEYLGYVFLNPSVLKLEKCLLLYGSGANGKSVFFEIVTALLGSENVSNYPLQSLTNENGYYRAKIANKLLNYASEINGKLETDVFKRLASGEPVDARLPYGDPFTLTNYAKFIFNVNELPKDVEHTHAYFRRFLIIPWEITIPEHEQDKELSKKIISNELSGVFNWILDGLKRLLAQKRFTDSSKVQRQIEEYKRQSDSVQMFMEEHEYEPASDNKIPLLSLYQDYKTYCISSGFHNCSLKTIGARLKNIGYTVERAAKGNIVYAKKNVF